MPGTTRRLLVALLFLNLISLPAARGGDWPLWRYDAQRSAASPDELPSQLELQWVRQLPRLKPAWPDQPKMQFDAAYEPIVIGQRLFVGSSYDNSVTAYDTRTGMEVWRFFAEGPVRFAPLAWQDKLYVVSDDGYLYCLRANDGSLIWRFRGGPSDYKILGNERLISAWPARGAPVIADGKLYFAAGIWPFMGIFLHALDATTGDVLWTNDGDGSIYIKQPHNSDSFAGVAPQGALVAIDNKLLIPGGRSVPACYDRLSGRMLYYQLAENGKRGGGSTVSAVDQLILNGGAAFDLQTEIYLGAIGDLVTFAEDQLYDYRNQVLRALNRKESSLTLQDGIDRKGAATKIAKWSIDELGKVDTPRLTALIKAGSRLYAGCEKRVLAVALPLPQSGTASPVWQAEISGIPASLVAADNRLFVVTVEGQICCFGEPAAARAAVAPKHELASLPRNEASGAKAESILETSGVRHGYCLAWGIGSGGLICELAQRSQLRFVVIEPDRQVATAFREKLRAAGVGGERITVLVADLISVSLPPYFASLAVMEVVPTAVDARMSLVAKTFASLRPFGGAAFLPVPSDQTDTLAESVKQLQLVGASWKPAGGMSLLAREGPLPGSADWTHEHADAANTRVSKDTIVKAPLGLLWFGGPTNDGILPRHGHGPQPQVVEGRLFIEGVALLRAMDIYTGRVLWEAQLPGIGSLYDNTAHQPGANASGTNYIATPDGIYVAYGTVCLKLDPATGSKIAEFKLPSSPGSQETPLWGYLNVFENYLVGGADPLFDPALAQSANKSSRPGGSDADDKKGSSSKLSKLTTNSAVTKLLSFENDNYSSSNRLVVIDRNSGETLWTATARSGFRHNAICIGGGRLYGIDRLSGAQFSRLKRRGENPAFNPRLVVFDLKTGKEVWSTEQDVFGTWLSYSVEHDVLVEAGRNARDTLGDEPKGMRAYRGGDGSVLWDNKSYTGPAMIHHNTILMAGSACDLLSGAQRMREHPLSGEPVQWIWSRNYGCNTPMASEHLLTFRSGAAGYFDLCNDGGTGNFGGFRSSCTNNLVVAGGLLTAPDYTRTCVCSYQNQTSLALVHMPEVETWTSFGAQTTKLPLRRVGINLAAPGDRKADDGTLWLEYPSVGGSSPLVGIKIDPEQPEWFRRHSSQIDGPGLNWVAASGAKGLTSLTIKLAESDSQFRPYTVRLHFVEPEEVRPGERLFRVDIQGKPVIPALDVAKESGGRNRSLVKEFAGIGVAQDLVIQLVPDPTAKEQASVLSGIEIQAQGW